jgi:hypothetical protein
MRCTWPCRPGPTEADWLAMYGPGEVEPIETIPKQKVTWFFGLSCLQSTGFDLAAVPTVVLLYSCTDPFKSTVSFTFAEIWMCGNLSPLSLPLEQSLEQSLEYVRMAMAIVLSSTL